MIGGTIARVIAADRFAFLRFVVVGVLNTAFGYAVYALLTLVGLAPQAALAIAFALGVVWNYFTHARLVFATRGVSRLPPYVLAYLGIYALNAAGLEALIRAGVPPVLAQGALVLPAAVLAFVAIGRVLTGRYPWDRRR